MIEAMKADHPQFKIRLPPSLKAALEAAAESNDQTLTAEIVARLADSFVHKSAGDQLEKARDEALDRLEATAQEISERVAALIAEKMKAGGK